MRSSHYSQIGHYRVEALKFPFTPQDSLKSGALKTSLSGNLRTDVLNFSETEVEVKNSQQQSSCVCWAEQGCVFCSINTTFHLYEEDCYFCSVIFQPSIYNKDIVMFKCR